MNTTNDMSAENPNPHTDLLDAQLRLRSQFVRKAEAGWTFAVPEEKLAEHRVDTVLGCIDEGVDAGLALAGSGILLGMDTAVEKLLPLVMRNELTEITSHAGCGAAALACRENGIETDDPDAYGIEFAKELTARLAELSGKALTYRHIPASEMTRPKTHDATVIYVAGGPFKPRTIHGLPQGFTVQPGLHPDPAYTAAELTVAAGIAFGDHGHGPDAFTPQHPLIIVPVGSTAGRNHDELADIALQVFATDQRPIVVALGISYIDAPTVSA